MTNDTLPDLEEIQRELIGLSIATSPSELHGLLCGWLAAGGDVKSNWFGTVLADDAIQAPGDQTELHDLGVITQAQLTDQEFGFDLMLPDESDPIDVRSGYLFEWCAGFVAGFGLGGGQPDALTEEGREAFNDLVTLSKSDAQFDGDDEGDEESYAEIVEYVRVAALLIHSEVAMAKKYRQSLN